MFVGARGPALRTPVSAAQPQVLIERPSERRGIMGMGSQPGVAATTTTGGGGGGGGTPTQLAIRTQPAVTAPWTAFSTAPVIPPIDLTPVAKAIDHMAQVVATLKPEKEHPPKNKKRRHEFTYDETGKKWMVTSENEE